MHSMDFFPRCPKHPPRPIPSYLNIIDYTPHGANFASVAILQLPICTAQSLYFFLSNPQSSLPSDSCQSVLCSYESVLSCLFICVHQIPHVSEIIWYLSFCDWLISLSIILARSIYAFVDGKISFFFTTEQYFIVVSYLAFFIHSSTDVQLGYFQILAIIIMLL